MLCSARTSMACALMPALSELDKFQYELVQQVMQCTTNCGSDERGIEHGRRARDLSNPLVPTLSC